MNHKWLGITIVAMALGLNFAWGQTISTVAGNGTLGYSGDGGPATLATMYGVISVAVDAKGNLFISNYQYSVVRRVDAVTGIITTVAGNGTFGFSGDGGPATSAQLTSPDSIAVDGAGNLYIADQGSARIRKVNAATGIITTVAGTGTPGYSGDGGPATSAQLGGPIGVALDSKGNLYIADNNNNVIRRVDGVTGIITTFAGTGVYGYTGDGGAATTATFNTILGVDVDSQGNVYISDGNNVIRKVNVATGIITTFAGNGTGGFSGDGGPATSASLNSPYSISFDAAGNGYITDTYNNRVRKVNATTGIITTVVGNGSPTYCGDGGPAVAACINLPWGTAFDGSGNLYIADLGNLVVRKVTGILTAPTPTPTATPSGGCDQFYVSANLFSPNQPVSIFFSTCDYPGEFRLAIYNSAGEFIKDLDSHYLNGAWRHSYAWDGKNKNGDTCASGVYLIYLQEPFGRKLVRVALVH